MVSRVPIPSPKDSHKSQEAHKPAGGSPAHAPEKPTANQHRPADKAEDDKAKSSAECQAHKPTTASKTSIEAQLAEVQSKENAATVPVYGSHYASVSLARWEMPESSMPKGIAYRMIRDEMNRDGTPAMNMASFVNTYMEEEAEKLMVEAMAKNLIDYEEYPATTDIQNRCVAMIAHLLNVPRDAESTHSPVGTSTVGSSEAIMLAVLAMKKRWQLKRRAEGKDTSKPNIVMNSAVQVCWEKAARYFEVEERYVYCTPDRYVIDPVQAVDLVDENTIGICAILGTTYTGQYEDVKGINDELVKRKVDCEIHVDAASGGFVAPFVVPDLEWDFRLPKVVSINLSGHKYGLVYPGVGWCIWRSQAYLPRDLIFNINYLGADQASFTLNFSRGAAQIIGQYYQLIRLGKEGYRAIMLNLTRTADYLSRQLAQTGFKILSSTGGAGLPAVAFRLDPAKEFKFDEFDVAHRLRERGWIIPAYTLAPHAEKIKLMRVVVREEFSQASCDDLVEDVKETVEALGKIKEEDWKVVREHLEKERGQFFGGNSGTSSAGSMGAAVMAAIAGGAAAGAGRMGSHARRHHHKTRLDKNEHYGPEHTENERKVAAREDKEKGDKEREHEEKMKMKTRAVC